MSMTRIKTLTPSEEVIAAAIRSGMLSPKSDEKLWCHSPVGVDQSPYIQKPKRTQQLSLPTSVMLFGDKFSGRIVRVLNGRDYLVDVSGRMFRASPSLCR